MTRLIALALVLAHTTVAVPQAKADPSSGDLDPVHFVEDFEGRLAKYGQPANLEPTSCSKISCRYEIGKDQFELTVSFDRSLMARWPARSTETDATRLFVAIETLLQDADAARAVMSQLSDGLIETPERTTLDASGYNFEVSLNAGSLTVIIGRQTSNAYRPAALKLK